MKKQKTHELIDLCLEGFVEDVAKELLRYKEEYSAFSNLRVYSEYISGGDYCASGYRLTLRGEKLETDAEELLREKQEAEAESRNKLNKKKLYEILKAEFEF